MPQDDLAAEMYEMTGALTAEAGLPAYEISNHAGEGGACRHNLVYHRTDRPRRAWEAERRRWAPGTGRAKPGWLAGQYEADGHGIETVSQEGGGDAVAEMLMMGLRLDEGVSLTELASRHGDVWRFLDRDALAGFEARGMLVRQGERLRVTPPGRLLLNRILSDLLAEAA